MKRERSRWLGALVALAVACGQKDGSPSPEDEEVILNACYQECDWNGECFPDNNVENCKSECFHRLKETDAACREAQIDHSTCLGNRETCSDSCPATGQVLFERCVGME